MSDVRVEPSVPTPATAEAGESAVRSETVDRVQATATPAQPSVRKSPENVAARKKVLKTYGIPAAIALLIVVVLVFGSGGNKPPPAQIGAQPDLAVGNPDLTSTTVADMLKAQDANRAKNALGNDALLNKGIAVIPGKTREFNDPLESVASVSSTGYTEASTEDDLSRAASAGNVPVVPVDDGLSSNAGSRRSTPRSDRAAQNVKAEPTEEDEAYARYSAYMKTPPELGIARVGTSVSVARAGSTEADAAGSQGSAEGDRATTTKSLPTRLVKTGQVLFATLDYEANSDSSDFVQATVQSGPFRGAKFLGSFRARQDTLELQFDTVSWKRGTYGIRAIGVDTEQPRVGMATSVDRHYLSRFGGIIAAATVRGIGEEKAREGTTVTTNGTTGSTTQTVPRRTAQDYAFIGAGQAAADASSLIVEYSRRPTTIKIAPGTPVGVNFTKDWLDQTLVETPPSDEGKPSTLDGMGASNDLQQVNADNRGLQAFRPTPSLNRTGDQEAQTTAISPGSTQ